MTKYTREEKNNFSTSVITKAEELKIDYLDAVIICCEEKNLEIEVAAQMINDVLFSKLEEEAQKNNVIPKSAKLPL